MKKNTIEMLGFAGLVASLVITTAGCTPVRRGSVALRDKTPENDRVLPESLEGETTGEIVEAVKEDAKPVPYWKLREQGLVDDTVKTKATSAKSTVSAGYTSYKVKKDDSLSKIAYRYGLRWQDVAAANPGLNPNKLKVGQVISLPGAVDTSKPVVRSTSKKTATASVPAGANVYTVQNGDYIGKIAGKFHVRSADIIKANNLKNDKIFVGQKLVIPTKGAAVKTTPKADPKPVTPVIVEPEVKEVVVPVSTPTTEIAEPKVDDTPVSAEIPSVEVPSEIPSVDVPAPSVDVPAPSVDVPAGEAVSVDVPSVPAPVAQQTHVVGDKEDIFAIAIRWGVSATDIMKANNLSSGTVAPGTVLVIPANK